MSRRPYLITWYTDRKERKKVLEWIRDEWAGHADLRNKDGRLDALEHMIDSGVGERSWWFGVTLNYLIRADKLGLDTPAGRQAVMKATGTMVDMAATMIQAYGLPPLPGYPSGEIHFTGDGCAVEHGRREISPNKEK